jgi:hypothetical protein
MFVFYICPRPVVLGGVSDGTRCNVYPMNLMGPIGDGSFLWIWIGDEFGRITL